MMRQDLKDAMPLAQLIALGGILFSLLWSGGRKDQELTELRRSTEDLRVIVGDLAKSQIGIAVNDAAHGERIADIQRRLDRLEGR